MVPFTSSEVTRLSPLTSPMILRTLWMSAFWKSRVILSPLYFGPWSTLMIVPPGREVSEIAKIWEAGTGASGAAAAAGLFLAVAGGLRVTFSSDWTFFFMSAGMSKSMTRSLLS